MDKNDSLDYLFAKAMYNKATLRCNDVSNSHIDVALGKLREAHSYLNRPGRWHNMAANAFLAIKWLDNPELAYYNYWTNEDEANFEATREKWLSEWKRLNGWQLV